MSEEESEEGYTQLSKAEAGGLRKALQKATTDSNEAWFEQCRRLHAVYYSGIGETLAPTYQLWGFKTFEDYVGKELGLKNRTALNMVDVAHFFTIRMGSAWKGQILSRQRMTILAHGVAKIDRDNLGVWITRALNMTPAKLESKLHPRRHKSRHLSFSFKGEEVEIVEHGIEQLMATGEFETRGEALASLFRRALERVA